MNSDKIKIIIKVKENRDLFLFAISSTPSLEELNLKNYAAV